MLFITAAPPVQCRTCAKRPARKPPPDERNGDDAGHPPLAGAKTSCPEGSRAKPPAGGRRRRHADLGGEIERGRELLAAYRRQIPDDMHAYGEFDPACSWLPRVKVRLVKLPHWTVRATGDRLLALLLAQLLYWLDGRKRNKSRRAHPPQPGRGLSRRWIATTAKLLAAETGLTEGQAEYGLARLEKREFISRKQKKFWRGGTLAGKKCSHVWLGPAARGPLAAAKISGRSGRKPLAVAVFLWAMRACGGNLNAAVVLSHLWHKVHLKHFDVGLMHGPPLPDPGPEPRPVRLGREAISQWSGLSMDQVKRALSRLRSLHLIRSAQSQFGSANINRFEVDYDRCAGFVLLCGGYRPPAGGAVVGEGGA